MYQIARARSEVYALLAAAFGPPGGLLREQSPCEVSQVLSRAAVTLSLPWLRGYGDELRAILEAWEHEAPVGASPCGCPKLEVEYNRLFAVAPLVPPYESVWRDPSRQAMGPWAVAAARCYETDGLSLATGFKDLPDHVVAELDYLAYLAGQEALALEGLDLGHALDYRGRALSFLNEHLGVWLPDLCRRAIAQTGSAFYLCVASLARDFVAWDQGRLDARPAVERADAATHCPPAQRGTVVVREDRCTLCGACVRACARGALQLRQGEGETSLVLASARCDGCASCQLLCPEETLAARVSEPETGTGDGREQVLVRSRVLRCSGCGQALPMAMAALKRLEAVLGVEALLCPDCRRKRMLHRRIRVTPGEERVTAAQVK